MSTFDEDSDTPSEAMMKLLAPDGYYHFLMIEKTAKDEIDEDLIKKNYRKLSLKHHPDKPGGDTDTFRLLNRAQTVLKTPKLRQQYDILGVDLDDDDEHRNEVEGTEGGDQSTTSQGIVHDMASMALTSVLQMGVRTILMATVSLLVVRYRWLLYPALAFLGFIAFRIHSSTLQGSSELLSPFLIGTGLILMYKSAEENGSGLIYWLGESLVIAMFSYNSVNVNPEQLPSGVVLGGIGAFSMVAALWFRGKFWNYIVVIVFELFLAIFIAMAFPVMEMVLEAILNEKLKKVGEKVRAQHKHMEKYYSAKR
eukprot:scaffold1474_cov132-Cylindrotheca_fusiformis.AAC.15